MTAVEQSQPVRVRLAEIVATLSLGVDLGFGQPMEHVLRQCVIALRMAERLGLDEQERSVVYYTALLVNVGCHSDAHEQAKWFGDDIALKSGKYEYELRRVRGAAASALIGSGNPPLHRFRSAEFALSGSSRSGRHDCAARRTGPGLGRGVGLPNAVQEALGSYEQWDGRGWPGALKGDAVPIASRLAQLAEFVEVAHPSAALGRRWPAPVGDRVRSSTRQVAALLCREAEAILGWARGDPHLGRVIAAEPSSG